MILNDPAILLHGALRPVHENLKVAQIPPYPKTDKSVHLIALYDRNYPMVTVVQLFASVGAPGYHVVTGRAPEAPSRNSITL